MSTTVKTQEQHYRQQIAAQQYNLQFMLKRRHRSLECRETVYGTIDHLRYLQKQL